MARSTFVRHAGTCFSGGVNIDECVGSTVSLDTGSGPVLLAVNSAARPCAWMETTIGTGAQRALRNKGGVRCTPLSDGTLSLGSAAFTVTDTGVEKAGPDASRSTGTTYDR